MFASFRSWDPPPLPERVTHYFVGLDLAQAQDPTALAVVERTVLSRQRMTSIVAEPKRHKPGIGARYGAGLVRSIRWPARKRRLAAKCEQPA